MARTMPKKLSTLAKTLRDWRAVFGYDRKEGAVALGIRPRTLENLENGRVPGDMLLQLISERLAATRKVKKVLAKAPLSA